ncbi:hypothetical protein GCM10010168_21010 [Actinoplanes ianthinogenes]|uniref:Uncharacterized protein n=1 Tax=Actinoplanes ianthinogenes TaxID=122358 RepID=A0ABM7M7Y9_9ACTN|nr:hypothetical protein [Actinoplanes ianthinogenes]BCJ47742.1 hypothetical protein Aiant_83990 [Actinoplanes ianthinogenes]GGR03853.1 hypothetical protein GCM10010168_21010 [Actinoplanes ianthinogenes]
MRDDHPVDHLVVTVEGTATESDAGFVCDERIGTIEHGRMDELLERGLIGEWERVLNGADR